MQNEVRLCKSRAAWNKVGLDLCGKGNVVHFRMRVSEMHGIISNVGTTQSWKFLSLLRWAARELSSNRLS